MSGSLARSLSSPMSGHDKVDSRIEKVYKLMCGDYRKNLDKIANQVDGNHYILSRDVPGQRFDLLELAIKKRWIELIRILVPYVELEIKKTYLHNMLSSGIPYMTIKEAVKHIDLNIPDRQGNPAIFYVNNSQQFLLLKGSGAHLDAVNSLGETFIHYKLRTCLSEYDLKKLLGSLDMSGIDFNATDSKDRDPLTVAISKGYTGLARAFIDLTSRCKVSIETNNWLYCLLLSKTNISEKRQIIEKMYPRCPNKKQILHCICDYYSSQDHKIRATRDMTDLMEDLFSEMSSDDVIDMLTETDNDKNTVVHKLCKVRNKLLLGYVTSTFKVTVGRNNDGDYPHDIYNRNKMWLKLEQMASDSPSMVKSDDTKVSKDRIEKMGGQETVLLDLLNFDDQQDFTTSMLPQVPAAPQVPAVPLVPEAPYPQGVDLTPVERSTSVPQLSRTDPHSDFDISAFYSRPQTARKRKEVRNPFDGVQ